MLMFPLIMFGLHLVFGERFYIVPFRDTCVYTNF